MQSAPGEPLSAQGRADFEAAARLAHIGALCDGFATNILALMNDWRADVDAAAALSDGQRTAAANALDIAQAALTKRLQDDLGLAC